MSDDEQVRRLLADARHTEPMPDDVAARLDEVLTGLAEDPVAPPQRTWRSADELAAARRRRTVRNWLVAAAAVVVVGVGVNQVDWSGMSVSSESADSATSGGDSFAAEEDDGGAAEDTDEQAPTASSARELAWREARLHLNADRFGEQVTRFRTTRATLGSTPAAESYDGTYQADGDASFSLVCAVGDLGEGDLVPVRYDGNRAWLVLREPEGESQVVDLYLCAADEPTRSITLPWP